MRLLAEAGAFDSLKENRRAALWQVEGMKKAGRPQIVLPAGGERAGTVAHVVEPDLPLGEPTPAFASLSDIETVAWDFRTMHHSARSHLLEPFSQGAHRKGPARCAHGRRHAGRQKPSTTPVS